ncbi:MAG: menaquinone biosynthesis protein [Saprospiraceae bacterium]|nr:menaquinone biosynthesis protein [Saprospiraceae bacterium]
MIEVIRVSAVAFLNTVPYIYGFDQIEKSDRFHIGMDTPSVCAHKLQDGKVDLGLAPVVVRDQLTEFHEVTDWGIGCDGAVGSVLMVSQKPIEDVDLVYLDPQSRTSNQLARIILEDHFQLNPTIALPGAQERVNFAAEAAYVLIGDRALAAHAAFPYIYDLGYLWKEMTGFPFVFARWVGSNLITDRTERDLSLGFELGMSAIPQLAERYQPLYGKVQVLDYLSNQIKYDLRDERFFAGQQAFLNRISLSETLTEKY